MFDSQVVSGRRGCSSISIARWSFEFYGDLHAAYTVQIYRVVEPSQGGVDLDASIAHINHFQASC